MKNGVERLWRDISAQKRDQSKSVFLVGLRGEARLLGGIRRSQFFGKIHRLPGRTNSPFHPPGSGDTLSALALAFLGALVPWHQEGLKIFSRTI